MPAASWNLLLVLVAMSATLWVMRTPCPQEPVSRARVTTHQRDSAPLCRPEELLDSSLVTFHSARPPNPRGWLPVLATLRTATSMYSIPRVPVTTFNNKGVAFQNQRPTRSHQHRRLPESYQAKFPPATKRILKTLPSSLHLRCKIRGRPQFCRLRHNRRAKRQRIRSMPSFSGSCHVLSRTQLRN